MTLSALVLLFYLSSCIPKHKLRENLLESAKYLAENRGNVPVDVIAVPEETDKAVAFKKLETLGISIDALSEEQKEHLGI